MADAVAGAAGKAAMGMFGPHPSITIVTFWQGIVEIAMRGVSVVVAFICIIAAAVSLDDLDSDNFDELDDIGEANNEDWNWEGTASLARSACGFLIFVAIMVMILEGAIIAQRFLNFGIVEKFNLIFIIVDMAISGVFAFLFFCLGISTAVYAGRFGQWESEARDIAERNGVNADDSGDEADLNEDLGGVSFFCFVGLLVFAGLVAFMAISFMLKWRNTKVRYVATPGALGGGTE